MPGWNHLRLMPSVAARIENRIEMIHDAIDKALRVVAYAEDRVFHGITLPAPQKVLSLSDPCAAFIIKGGREPVVDTHIARIGTIPTVLTVDDGYSCRASRKRLLAKPISVVSFSGSKGKAMISDDEWESVDYRAARNHRSAVESLISILRSKFHLVRLSRRGLDRVRSELMEKAIAYNVWRMAWLRKKKNEQSAA